MRRNILIIIFFSILLLLFYCSSDTSGPNNSVSYTPLSLGDITQLIYIKDSSTTLFKIVDKTLRKDGKSVYIGEWQYGTQNSFTSYYFISDEYFIATELDTVEDDSLLLELNPFREQRLAKSFPKSGDTWLHTHGDPDSVYWVADEIGVFSTFFGEVSEVYGFRLFDKNDTYPFLITYYGGDLGWIGSSSFGFDSTEVQFLCSYKKVSGKTYGELWPEKDFSGTKTVFDPHSLSKLIYENRMKRINGER